MNLSRIAGVAALGAAATLTLAGCIQLPSMPQAPTTTQPTTTQPQTTDPGTTPTEPATNEGDALVDTTWSGTAQGPEVTIDVSFTFESDGTLYITRWNDQTDVPFDAPTDTWSIANGALELRLSSIEEIDYIDYSGAYAGSSPITLTGQDGVGTAGYTITLTQG